MLGKALTLVLGFRSVSSSVAADSLQAARVRCSTKRTGILLCTILALAWAGAAAGANPNKVLRVALHDIDSFDPHRVGDAYSLLVNGAIFEALYEWDYLARPAKLAPNTAVALPEITNDGLVWTIRLKPGIYFTDDPAFKGKPRELVTEDYVYSFKRFVDPDLNAGGALLARDLIAELEAVDRYTLRLKLKTINYPVTEAILRAVGAVAREVVEAADGDIRARPVGTGPFRLKEWKRASRIVLDANPNYRAIAFPASTDPQHAELVRAMLHRKLPQIGAIQINLVEDEPPMVREFEAGHLDYIELRTPIAEKLLKQSGITHYRFPTSIASAVYFNMEDPVVGGLDERHTALRRAMALGLDVDTLIKTVYGGRALPATQMLPPGVTGHDPDSSANSRYDPQEANRLLDAAGYGKRDAEGYRLAPDAKPLILTYTTRGSVEARETQALWKTCMEAIGLRMQFREVPLQELFKAADAGDFQILARGFGGAPSGFVILLQLYGRQTPLFNPGRFRLPEYDLAMEQFLRSGDPASQIAAARKMSEVVRDYAPLIPLPHRVYDAFAQRHIVGFYPSEFGNYWKYIDIDSEGLRTPKRRE